MRIIIIYGALFLVNSLWLPISRADEVTRSDSHLLDQYVSAMFGNGNASVGGNMQWRTFELRIGASTTQNQRFDFVHYNEGHPVNNHRDGFSIQVVRDFTVDPNMRLELGIGPYLSFNTTRREKSQYNDKILGILVSAVALYYFNARESRNLHLRIEYNHVEMPQTHESDAILLGIGMNFGSHSASDISEDPLQISIMGANFKTNRSQTNASIGGHIEVKQYDGEHLAFSVGWIREGNDLLVNRSGVTTQAWVVWPVSENWRLSAGVGPYLASNQLQSDATELDGLISMEVQRQVGDLENGMSLIARFSRIATDDSTDRDIFAIGIAKKY